jgi:hypothetical protein
VDKLGNIFSQFGEDLEVEGLLIRIKKEGYSDGWACEFGAWDGFYLSNTANLIVNHGFQAVLIEGNSKRFQELEQNMFGYPVTCLNEYVGLDGDKRLDMILNSTLIPKNFDLLSIDIDGADYWVLKSLSIYRPKIIVIEYNPTIPASIEFINQKNITVNEGTSIRSLAKLAEEMNYSICGITTCNLILVDSIYGHLFQDKKIEVADIQDPPYVTKIWQTFDGRVHVTEDFKLIWHNISISQKMVQLIPEFIQKFPENMSIFQKLFFRVWKRWIKRDV